MRDVFARMYEWFGLMPLYSHDMSEFLKGMDTSCMSYFALPAYFYIGLAMIIVTGLIFALQYDLISSARFPKREHWELAAMVVFITNFLIAFSVPYVAILIRSYCILLKLTVLDCIMFGLSNAIWALIFFAILNTVWRILTQKRP